MVDYNVMVYEEHQIDRYRRGVHYYFNALVKNVESLDELFKAMIRKSGNLPYGTIIEITTSKSNKVLRKVEKTERVAEPWGSQWTEFGKVSYNSKTKNYIYRNGKLYVVMGSSLNATKVC